MHRESSQHTPREHMHAACVSWRFYTNGTNFLLPGNNLLVGSEIERNEITVTRSDKIILLFWVYFGFLIFNSNRNSSYRGALLFHYSSTQSSSKMRHLWSRRVCHRVNQVPPLSVSRTFPFLYVHSVAPYVIFLVFVSLPSFLQQRHLEGSSHTMWPIPSFAVLYVSCSFPLWLSHDPATWSPFFS